MQTSFESFAVEGASDWLLRSASSGPMEKFEAELRERTNSAQVSRAYSWNPSAECFSVASTRSNSSYSVYPATARCTCAAYKHASYPDKTCVHVQDVARQFGFPQVLRSPLYLVVSTKEQIPFRAISNVRVTVTDAWFAGAQRAGDWLYSTKRDGVRVVLRPPRTAERAPCTVLTRNGLRLVGVELALRRALNDFPTVELECELTIPDEARTTSTLVQREVLHAMEPVEYRTHFQLWAFDVFAGTGTFGERADLARQEAERCGLQFVEQKPLGEVRDAKGLMVELAAVLAAKHEGLVLQRADERYAPGQRSSPKYNFKLKRSALPKPVEATTTTPARDR